MSGDIGEYQPELSSPEGQREFAKYRNYSHSCLATFTEESISWNVGAVLLERAPSKYVRMSGGSFKARSCRQTWGVVFRALAGLSRPGEWLETISV